MEYVPRKGDLDYHSRTGMQLKIKALERKVESFKNGSAYQAVSRRCERQTNFYKHKADAAEDRAKAAESRTDRLAKRFNDLLQDIYDDQEKKRADELKWYRQELSKANARESAQREEIRQLKAELREEREMRYAAQTEAEELKDQLDRRQRQLNKNSRNSSKPSSMDSEYGSCGGSAKQSEEGSGEASGRKKIPNSRVKSGKRPGGQPCHEGHRRRRMTPTKTVHPDPPDYILNDPDYVPYGPAIIKQTQDFKMSVEATDWIGQKYVNTKTGDVWTPEFPEGACNEVNYASGIKTLILYLVMVCNVPVRKAQSLLYEASGHALNVSIGFIQNLKREFAKRTKKERDRMLAELHNEMVLHIDTTGGKVNGKSRAVSVCGGEHAVVLLPTMKKGDEVVEAFGLDEYFPGALISDCEAAFLKIKAALHQICIAHLIRELLGIMENEPNRSWAAPLRELLQFADHAWKEAEGAVDPDTAAHIDREYDRILEIARAEYEYEPPTKYNRDGFNLQLRMRKHRDSILCFVHNEGIEPTNNAAERWLRAFKRRLKQQVTFRSDQALDDACALLSIVLTERLIGGNVYMRIADVFERPPDDDVI